MTWDDLKLDIHTKWKAHWYRTHPPEVGEYAWNYLFTGGKEIRARLFCELWGHLSPDLAVCGELAFAIECIHVASIVLDDTPWMDNAARRRGRDTLHVVFSPKKAVLIASELMDIVRHIWRTCRPPHVSTVVWECLLVQKLEMLAVGQLYDLEKMGTLMELASLKTGVLFELVAETVALCVGMDTGFWRQWGRWLGVLFQWMDDWHDREEDAAQGNRNAFLEAYEDTRERYHVVWRKLEAGIGSSWFVRPFGAFMRGYFTGSIPGGHDGVVQASSLRASLSLGDIEALVLPKDIGNAVIRDSGMTGTDIVRFMYTHSREFFTLPSLRTNLWGMDEKDWERAPDVRELLDRAPIGSKVLFQ